MTIPNPNREPFETREFVFAATDRVFFYKFPVKNSTKSCERIMDQNDGLLTYALNDFIRKNADYKDASDALHLPGQVSDLWRKIVKLKASVIDGAQLNGESEMQLIQDLFGHVLLAMYYKHKQDAERIQRRPWLGPATGKAPWEDQSDQPVKANINPSSLAATVNGMSEEVKQEIRDGILGKYDPQDIARPMNADILVARNNPARFAVEMAEQMTDAEWDRQDFDVFHATLAQAYHSINRTRLMPYADAEMPSND